MCVYMLCPLCQGRLHIISPVDRVFHVKKFEIGAEPTSPAQPLLKASFALTLRSPHCHNSIHYIAALQATASLSSKIAMNQGANATQPAAQQRWFHLLTLPLLDTVGILLKLEGCGSRMGSSRMR